MHYSFMGEKRLTFLDSDLLYKGALLAGFNIKFHIGIHELCIQNTAKTELITITFVRPMQDIMVNRIRNLIM